MHKKYNIPRVGLFVVQRMRRGIRWWWWWWTLVVTRLIRQGWSRRRRFHRMVLTAVLSSIGNVIARVILIDALFQTTVRVVRIVLRASKMSVRLAVGLCILATGVSAEQILVGHRLMTTDCYFVLRLGHHRAVLTTTSRVLWILIVLVVLTVLSIVVLSVLSVWVIVTGGILSNGGIARSRTQTRSGAERRSRRAYVQRCIRYLLKRYCSTCTDIIHCRRSMLIKYRCTAAQFPSTNFFLHFLQLGFLANYVARRLRTRWRSSARLLHLTADRPRIALLLALSDISGRRTISDVAASFYSGRTIQRVLRTSQSFLNMRIPITSDISSVPRV